jgi:hypothetical protein
MGEAVRAGRIQTSELGYFAENFGQLVNALYDLVRTYPFAAMCRERLT